jgi:WD40 repeat protein
VASIANDATVSIWNLRTHARVVWPLIGGTDAHVTGIWPANDVAFDPHGRLVAASVEREGVRLWRTGAHGLVGRALRAPSGSVTAVTLSPDGKTLLTMSAATSRLWDVRTRRPLAPSFAGAIANSWKVAFSPDSSTLAAIAHVDAGPDLLHVWSARDGHRIGAPLISRGASLIWASALSNEDMFAGGAIDGTLRLWDVRPRPPLGRALGNEGGWVRGLAFTDRGAMLVSAGVDGAARLWDVRVRRPVGPPLTQPGDDLAVASSPDGRTLATAGSGGVRLWDAATHRLLGRSHGRIGTVKAIAFAPDGRTLASAGDDGRVRLWTSRTGRSMGAPLDAHAGAIDAVAFDHDGDLLATAGQDGAVRLWDVVGRRPVGRPMRASPGLVDALAFSPDDSLLATGGAGRAVWLWDVGSRRPLGPPLRGHTDLVSSVAFSPDGGTLASAGADKTVRLWDVRTHRELGRPLEPHDGWLNAVAFDPRDGRLAEAGQDGVIRLWDPILWSHDLGALTRRVCGIVRRSLTRAEWAEFLPGRSYHATCPAPAAR